MATTKVKAEVKPASVRAELKREPGVKREPADGGARPKVEGKFKDEDESKADLKAKLKLEQKREAKVKPDPTSSHVDALLQRGLQLRAAAEEAKREAKVKVESGKAGKARGKAGKGKRGARKKGSAARRNASREVINREIPLSKELAALVGAPALSRPEVVKRLWAYCKQEGMINPENSREILFKPKLARMFGRPSARLTDLSTVLLPHLHYAGSSAAAAAEPQGSRAAAAAEAPSLAKRQSKEELPTNVKRACKTDGPAAKPEQACKRQFTAKAESSSPAAALAKVVKSEADVQELARGLVPRLRDLCPEGVTVECLLPMDALEVEAVALPLPAPSAAKQGALPPAIRGRCEVNYLEGQGGKLEPWASASLDGLDPKLAYMVVLEVRAHGGEAGASPGRSAEVRLPQRAQPMKWSAQEALLWCATLDVPEFAQKVREYRLDGVTLLALGEEDLRAFGLVAPVLLRRILSRLKTLKAG